MKARAIPQLVPERHAPHPLHAAARVFPETNCYADLWIELLHALGLEPRALFSHALSVDFEGDQWTFFKPLTEDLRMLYGLDVQELQVWDRFGRHVLQQLALGRVVLAETDAFYLPDTAGTSYRTAHVKTTIGIERADTDARRLGYFHNGGYHMLDGDDFDAVLAPNGELCLYVETIKLDRLERLDEDDLRRRAKSLLFRDVARRPRQNPIIEYGRHFERDLGFLRVRDLDAFHPYAFATLRQCGAAFELAARHLEWLAPNDTRTRSAVYRFDEIAVAAKASMLKLARAVTTHKAPEILPLFECATQWDEAFAELANFTEVP